MTKVAPGRAGFSDAQLRRAKQQILDSIQKEGTAYQDLFLEFHDDAHPEKDRLFVQAMEELDANDRLRFLNMPAVGMHYASLDDAGNKHESPVQVAVFKKEHFEAGVGAFLGPDHPQLAAVLAGTCRPQERGGRG